MSEIVDVTSVFTVYDWIVDVASVFDVKPAEPVMVDTVSTFDVEGFTPMLMFQDGELVRRRVLVRRGGEWVDP